VSEYIVCQKAFDAAESGEAWQGDDDVKRNGSNAWSNSNIREWLNSSSKTVKFTTKAPTKSAVLYYNAYVDEPGFLSNFTRTERNMINAVSHEGIKDKVFLMSVDEINTYLGTTDDARIRKLKDGTACNYWTRTPFPTDPNMVRDVDFGGGFILNIYSSFAFLGDGGVLPALNIKSDIFNSGKGTFNDPKKLD